MEFILMLSILGAYGLLGCLLVTAIFLTLLGIDLVFRTHFGRRATRKFLAFFRDE